jgi:alcohol dehydrogenase class IV
MAFAALPRVIERPDEVEVRGKMQLAALVSGIGLMNGGGGIAGAFSYPLGTHYKIPHGLAHAVFTPAVVRWNVEHGSTAYAPLYDAVVSAQGMNGGAPEHAEGAATAVEKGRAFADALAGLFQRVGGPLTLSELGLSRGDVADFARLLQQAPLHAAIDQNPAPFAMSDVDRFIGMMA